LCKGGMHFTLRGRRAFKSQGTTPRSGEALLKKKPAKRRRDILPPYERPSFWGKVGRSRKEYEREFPEGICERGEVSFPSQPGFNNTH